MGGLWASEHVVFGKSINKLDFETNDRNFSEDVIFLIICCDYD